MTAEELGRIRRGLPFLLDQLAVFQDLEFSNGVIEVERAGAPEPGAGEGARGFVGIVFRTQGKNTYDTFYLRATNARAERPTTPESHIAVHVLSGLAEAPASERDARQVRGLCRSRPGRVDKN